VLVSSFLLCLCLRSVLFPSVYINSTFYIFLPASRIFICLLLDLRSFKIHVTNILRILCKLNIYVYLRIPCCGDINSVTDKRLQTRLVSLLVINATPSNICDIFNLRGPSARLSCILTSIDVLHNASYNRYVGCTLLVAQLVEALRYKPEGRGIDSRWCHWNFSLT
jgi:hypothetical protein